MEDVLEGWTESNSLYYQKSIVESAKNLRDAVDVAIAAANNLADVAENTIWEDESLEHIDDLEEIRRWADDFQDKVGRW